ncbi:MAG: hypothetical protein ABH854_05435 [Candidatus Diapherotrites archaeon]
MGTKITRSAILVLFLIIVLAALVRFSPGLAGSMGGPDPHFHTRMAELVVSGEGVPVYDALSNQGRWYTYAPLYHLMYALLGIFSGLPVKGLVNFFPVLYGCAGVLLVFIFARRLFGVRAGVFAALALAVMSMHIVRTASYSRPDGLALLIVPAALYLLYTQRFKAAALLSVVQVLLHPLSTAYLLTLMIAIMAVHRVKGETLEYKKYAGIIVLTVAVFLSWLLTRAYPIELYLSDVSYSSAELSALSLLSILMYFTFSWIFIILGVFKLPERGKYFLLAWFVYTLLFAVLGFRLAIFLSIPAAIIAGWGLLTVEQALSKYKIVFYALLLLLAGISIGGDIYNDAKYINTGERAAMLWLRDYTDENATIAASWDRGHPLTYYAQRKVLIDGYFEFAPGLDERLEVMETLISTADCGKISEAVQDYGIDYFYVHTSALGRRNYMNGILEAKCEGMALVYSSEKARVFAYGQGG